MTPRKPSPRYFRALALEPRILLDAAAVATAAEVAAQVDVPASADAPGVAATPTHSTLTLTDTSDSFPAINLFDDVQVTLDNAAAAPVALTLSVNTSADNQALGVDGTLIPLRAGSGTTADNAYTYEVSVSGGTTTLTLTLEPGGDAADVQALVDSITYQALDNHVESGTLTISLHSLRDADGDVADLHAISSTVSVINQTTTSNDDNAPAELNAQALTDQGPMLGAETGALGLAELITSNDWPSPYAGIQNVVSVGDHVYAVRTTTDRVYDADTDSNLEVNVSSLYIFQRAADGTLSLRETLDGSAQNRLSGAWDIAASTDGSTLYVSNEDGVAIFRRTAESGSLEPMGSISSVGLVGDVLSVGEYLYVSTGDALKVYQRAGDAWVERDSQTATGEFVQLTALQASADGQLLFAGNSGGDSLVSVYRINANGSLSFLANAGPGGGEHYVRALTLSADGQTLYALDNSADGPRLQALTVAADGRLSVSGTPSVLGAGAQQIIVSPDNSALMVLGTNRIELLTRNNDNTFTLRQQYSDFSDTSLGELRGANLSADGKQLYLSGTFPWNDGLLVLDLKAASAIFTEGSDAVALLPRGTLSDPQLDALNSGLGDYNGASLVIAREGSAQAEDQFGFLAGNGLSLVDGQVLRDGVAIATFSQTGGVLTLSFITSVSRADAQNVLRGVAYSNSSNDPAAAASMRVSFDNGDGQSASSSAGVVLVGVNDAAVVSTTAQTPTFTAEGEPVRLFDNTLIDTVEAGQSIWYVAVTIDSVRPGDVLGVGGGRIALNGSSGVNTTETGQQYNLIRNSDGSTTVWLYTTNRPVSEVQTLVDSLTYNHTGNDTSGQRSITLSIREMADENVTTNVATPALVTLAAPSAPNTPPTLGDIPTDVAYTEQADPVLLGPAATLGDAQLDGFNGGAGNYDGATLTIALGEGKSTADSLTVAPANGLSLVGNSLQKDGIAIASVTVADGVMSIAFSSAAGSIPTSVDVQNTLRQITYANSSDVPVDRVEVTIRLADQRGLSVERQTSIAISAVNDTPVLAADPVLSLGDLAHLQTLGLSAFGLSSATTSVASGDGSRVYLADAQGNIALFSRDADSGELSHVRSFTAADGVTGIGQLQLSADGTSLYALRSDGNAIVGYSVDAAGSLSHAQTLISDYATDFGSLNNIRAITLAADGTALYLINNYNHELATLTRDTTTGALSYASAFSGSMWSEPYLWQPTDIASQGERIVVVTNNNAHPSLIVYQRGADGELNQLSFTTHGDSLSDLQHVTLSADGNTVFVASASQVDAFAVDPTSGALTHLGSISGLAIQDIAVASNGAALFVSLADGTLNYYATANLGLISAQSALSGAGQITVTADGGVIVAGNDALHTLNAPAVPGPIVAIGGAPTLLAPALSLSDAELDDAGNYQGASILITGQNGDSFGFQGNASYSLDGTRILLNGSEVATLTQNAANATLSFSAELSREQANAILRQITYVSSATSPGSHDVTLVLNDGNANSTPYSLQVTLTPPNQAPVREIDDYVLDQATAGMGYQQTLPEGLFSDPDGDALTWSASGLPAGLTFDPISRTLSGSTTVMGQHSITITVMDGEGGATSLELTLDVLNAVPVADGSYTLGSATVGQSFSATLPESLFSDSNDSDLSWTLELPTWLSYDPATRTLSGTAPAQAGNHEIIVTARDPHGATVSRTLVVTVSAATSVPELRTANGPLTGIQAAPRFGEPALVNALFTLDDASAGDPAPLAPAPVLSSGLLRNSASGLADGRGALSQQLANADTLLTDTGYQSPGGFSFDGSGFTSSVDLNATSARSISLMLPIDLPDGSNAQRVSLANGLPLPSGMSFDARSGELRIEREWLKRQGTLHLTLISRDAEGREQRTPVEIHSEATPAAAPRDNASRHAVEPAAAAPESLPAQLRQATFSALLDDALELLEQLSELSENDLKHTA